MSPFTTRVRRFLQKPGTADLSRHQRLLPVIAAAEEGLREVPDADLAGRASQAKDLAGFCAAGREAAGGPSASAPSTCSFSARW